MNCTTLIKSFLIVVIISMASAMARPNHFAENNQLVAGQEPNSNAIDTGIKPWQMELLAQRLAELNQLNGEYAFDRDLRSGSESKRQSRYRLCYFNPVSCFRK